MTIDTVNVKLYTVHYRTVPQMHLVHRVLLKQLSLQRATESGDDEVWTAHAERVPDHWTNHRKCTTDVRVELYPWHAE